MGVSEILFLVLTGGRILSTIILAFPAVFLVYHASIYKNTTGSDDSGRGSMLGAWAIILGSLFISDVTTLPINIFYFISILLDVDTSAGWIQFLATASPIMNGVLIAAFIVAAIFVKDLMFVLHLLILPQLIQLVPAIAYAIYV